MLSHWLRKGVSLFGGHLILLYSRLPCEQHDKIFEHVSKIDQLRAIVLTIASTAETGGKDGAFTSIDSSATSMPLSSAKVAIVQREKFKTN